MNTGFRVLAMRKREKWKLTTKRRRPGDLLRDLTAWACAGVAMFGVGGGSCGVRDWKRREGNRDRVESGFSFLRESSEMQGTKPTGPFHSTMSLGFLLFENCFLHFKICYKTPKYYNFNPQWLRTTVWSNATAQRHVVAIWT